MSPIFSFAVYTGIRQTEYRLFDDHRRRMPIKKIFHFTYLRVLLLRLNDFITVAMS